MDSAGLALDVVHILSDIVDRVRAPKRIATATRYVLNRLESSDAILRQIGITSEGVTEQVNQHKQLIGIDTENYSKFRRSYLGVVRMLRRDRIQGLYEGIIRMQDDTHMDAILLSHSKQLRLAEDTNRRVQEIQLAQRIACNNIEALRALLSCQHTRLRQHENGDQYVLLSEIGNRQLPPWGKAPFVQKLFADEYSRFRLDVLLAVTSALAHASHAGWHHRRLSAADVAVHRAWFPSTETSHVGFRSDATAPAGYPSNKRPGEPAALVLNFLCPVTSGCATCPACRTTLDNTRVLQGDEYLMHRYFETATRTTTFSNREFVNDGCRADSFALSSFTLWLYAGTTALDHDVYSEQADETLARVPWPLRWLVTARQDLPLFHAHAYLQELSEYSIHPHLTRLPLVRDQEERNDYESAVLASAATSAAVGMATGEAEGALHLGTLLLMEASRLLQRRKRGDAETAALKACECYKASAMLGAPEGARLLAKVYALWLDKSLPGSANPEVSVDNMLLLLLDAAFGGDSTAMQVLERIQTQGIFQKASLFEDVDVEEHDILPEAVFEKALWFCNAWRRGILGFEVNIERAYEWLESLHKKGYAPASVQFALLIRQSACSTGDLSKAHSIMAKVSQGPSTSDQQVHVLRDACFWLGQWYHFGLEWKEGDRVCIVIPRSDASALPMYRTASNLKHVDGMVMYAKFLRQGLGGAEVELPKAKNLTVEAMEGGSVIAFCALAERKRREALELADVIAKYQGADVNRRGEGGWFRIFGGGSRRTDSSMSSDHDVALYRDEETGRYKPEAVARLFEIAVRAVENAPRKLRRNKERALNPLPLYLTGEIMYKHRWVWADHDPKVRNREETKQQFVSRKAERAREFLQKAAEMLEDSEWKKWRVDYRQYDWNIVKQASELLDTINRDLR